eukprot:2336110-Amphidinium_carterae.1
MHATHSTCIEDSFIEACEQCHTSGRSHEQSTQVFPSHARIHPWHHVFEKMVIYCKAIVCTNLVHSLVCKTAVPAVHQGPAS